MEISCMSHKKSEWWMEIKLIYSYLRALPLYDIVSQNTKVRKIKYILSETTNTVKQEAIKNLNYIQY